MVKLAGRLAQLAKASAKTTRCKPLSRRYEFDSSKGQFVCLDMFVNGLAGICWSGGFKVHRSCLEDGHISFSGLRFSENLKFLILCDFHSYNKRNMP